MNPSLLGGIVEGVGKIADDLHTSDEERAKMVIESKKLDNELLLAQTGVNKVEAGSSSLFVSGWRPAVGWVCVVALATAYIPKALILTGVWLYQTIVIIQAWNGTGTPPVLTPYPDLGLTDIIGLLAALLGMAGLRSFDKRGDVATKSLG
jgi:hypothetical protein